MRNYNSFQVNTVGGQTLEIEQQGEVIFIRDSVDEVTVYLDSPSNDGIPLQKGERLVTKGFRKIYLVSPSSQVVKMIVSPKGEADIEGVTVVGDIVIASTKSPDKPVFQLVTLTTINQVYSLLTANPKRQSAVFQADRTNTDVVYIFPTGGVVGDGVHIYPGESFVIDTAAAWSAACASAAHKVRVIDNKWV